MLDTLSLYQEFTDPRKTRNMPEEFHALIVRLLPKPWALCRFEIKPSSPPPPASPPP
jgi:hypothetical protein